MREAFKDMDRVIKLSKKPRRDEYILIDRVTGLGIVAIGFVEFLIRMAAQIIKLI